MSVFPVTLVGAGPGDPELLTLRAVRALEQADVVLLDDLVDRRVLGFLRPHARVLQVGKRGGCASTDQAFIHKVMIREARSGQRVVRLKGGDPFLFGRGGEECDALREAGLAVDVVPGITAGLAAPAAVGIAVTDRRHTPGVAFITGHNGEHGSPPNWAALAQSGLTLVVYMGLSRVSVWSAQLLCAGLCPQTPAAVVQAAHTPEQRHLLCTLGELAAEVRRRAIASPAIVVIGSVAAAANALAAVENPIHTPGLGGGAAHAAELNSAMARAAMNEAA